MYLYPLLFYRVSCHIFKSSVSFFLFHSTGDLFYNPHAGIRFAVLKQFHSKNLYDFFSSQFLKAVHLFISCPLFCLNAHFLTRKCNSEFQNTIYSILFHFSIISHVIDLS